MNPDVLKLSSSVMVGRPIPAGGIPCAVLFVAGELAELDADQCRKLAAYLTECVEKRTGEGC